MAIRYLLDTNTASFIIKGNHPNVESRLVRVPLAQLAISVVTEGELRSGAARLPGAKLLHALVEAFFLRVSILPWDSDAAAHYGQLRARLEGKGQPMGSLDTMIGAHALSLGSILVSNDRDFTRIDGLSVEDWTE
jgi:tRNA(fMet)-specific endonuclease VapC